MDEMIELLPSIESPATQNIPLGQTIGQYIPEPIKRFGESVLGAPGTAESLLTSGVQYLTGMEPAKVPGILDIGKSIVSGQMPETSRTFFPTPEEIRTKFTEPVLGKPTKPRNMFDEWAENMASTAGSLVAGIPGLGGMSLGKAAKLGGLGASAKQLAKSIGLGETPQDLIEMGTVIAGDMVGTRKAFVKNMNDLYKSAEDLSTGHTIHAHNISDTLIKQKKYIKDFLPKDKKEVQEIIDTTAGLIEGKGGAARIPVEKVWSQKRRLNDYLRKLYTEEEPSKDVLHSITEINNSLKSSLQNFGNRNPEFKKTFNTAEAMFAGLNKRSKINKLLQKHVRFDSLRNPAVQILLGAGAFGKLPTALAGAGSAYLAKEGTQLAEFLYNSPHARELYTRTLGAALKDNGPLAARYTKKLDDQYSAFFKNREEKPEEMIELL